MLASVGVLLLMHMTEMFTTQYPGLHNSVLLVYLFLFTVFVFLLPSHFRQEAQLMLTTGSTLLR